MTAEEILYASMILSVVIIISVVCREIICSYWKINKRVDLLTEQNKLLKEIRDILSLNGSDKTEIKDSDIKTVSKKFKV